MNSAGYVKELCLDFGIDTLDLNTKVDIEQAIQRLCSQNAVMLQALRYFVLYLMGYTADEIANRLHLSENDVKQALERFVIALAEESGYTDDGFIKKIPNRLKIKAELLLERQSTTFNDYDIHVR